jgi:HK97 family phage major capsid protein
MNSKAREVLSDLKETVHSTVENQEKRIQELERRLDVESTKANRPYRSGSAGSGLKSTIQSGIQDYLSKADRSLSDLARSGTSFTVDASGSVEDHSVKIGPAARKDLTTGNTTGRVTQRDRRRGIIDDPERQNHIRDAMNIEPVQGSHVDYVQQTGYTNNAAPTSENTAKPESEMSFTEESEKLQTIPHLARVSNRMLDDIPNFAEYASNELRDGLLNVEDSQILYGDGVEPNLNGIAGAGAGTAFDNTDLSNAFPGNDASDTATRIDVLRYAVLQARKAQFDVSAIWLNPVDAVSLNDEKDADGNYIDVPELPQIVQSTAVDVGDFFVGAFATSRVIALGTRAGIQIGIYEQDRDNVSTNKTTIRAEERVQVVPYRPEGVVHGTFSDALTFA